MILKTNIVKIEQLIQKSRYENIDIIVASEELNKSTTLINTFYSEKDKYLSQFLFKTQIKHSDTFAKNTVKLDTIWTNPYYWKQKQTYEELISEIL